jgi:hypothetical protein
MHFKKLAQVVLGIVAFLGAVFPIIQGFRDYRPPVPKLQAAVVNVEHVSARTEIPGVKISLAFKDQSVPDLWLCRVRLQNVGGITLSTTGSKPNTQNPILIAVPQNYEILQIEPKGIDPKDSGFEAQIRQSQDSKGVADKHQFEVIFEQWRKGEAIEAVLYLSGSGEHLDRPKLVPKGRPILDGDVVPIDISSVASPEIKGRSFLDRLTGPSWASIIRLYAILSLGASIIWLGGRDTFLKTILVANWKQGHPTLIRILESVLFFGLYAALFSIIP